MTSLAKQLKRLKTPQTEEFRQQKYRISFLYDRKEASSLDCDTYLRLARKGFKKLVKWNESLQEFSDLFSEESKEIERSTLTSEENSDLSDRLRKYINNSIVPFFIQSACHETLEYLIYKYKIHTYQPNDLLCALLPYHETRIFARALQIIPELDETLWSWLDPYKREGVPVPKERILAVLSSRAKLPLVSLLGDKLIEINKDSPKAGVFTSFYTTTMMCLLDRDLDEKFFVIFLPQVYRLIKKSATTSSFMAGLVLVGYLAYTQELEESYLLKIKDRLTKTHAKLRNSEEKNQQMLDEYFAKVVAVIDRRENNHV